MNAKAAKQRDPSQTVALQVRLREELRAQIEAAASKSGNSMNSEIIARLEKSFREEGGVIPPHARLPFYAIAITLQQIEAARGKTWAEDRAVAYAMSMIAGDYFLSSTPMLNREAIEAVLARWVDLKATVERRCGYLLEVGAIKRVPQTPALAAYDTTERGLFGGSSVGSAPKWNSLVDKYTKGLPPPEWTPAVILVETQGYQMNVDLNQPAETWDLSMDGRSLSAEEAVGVGVLLRSLIDLSADVSALHDEISQATADEDAAKNEGKALLKQVGRSTDA